MFFLLIPLCAAQDKLRTLVGTVTDRQKEPLKGAVVQVQEENSDVVVSYITQRDGSFSFKRLRADTDYYVWATYRQTRSKRRELSHFSTNSHPVLTLTVKLP